MNSQEKNSLFPEFPKLLFDELWLNKVHDLLMKLQLYDQLFGTEEKVGVLNRVASALFYFVQKALESDIISTTARLIENRKTISIPKLIGEIRKQDEKINHANLDSDQKKFRAEMYELVNAFESKMPETKRLLISRNQFVAHNAPKKPKAESGASIKDIKEITNAIKAILLKVSQYCRDTDIIFRPFNEFKGKDGDALIEFIQESK